MWPPRAAAPDLPALVDGEDGRVVTFGELREATRALAAALALPRRGLVFARLDRDVPSVLAYLAPLEAGHAVALLDAATPVPLFAALVERYAPDLVLSPQSREPAADALAGAYDLAPPPAAGLALRRRRSSFVHRLHPDLRVLLPTSGTTGSPKLVRLSERNLRSNAAAIAEYLDLGPGDRALAHLPLHYAYGLSVLNSHLHAGACAVLSRRSPLERDTWDAVREHGCTSLAGVPYTFELLRRAGFSSMRLPTLRTLTQAGGRMDPDRVVELHHAMEARGGRLFVMYGQTEATARIAYLPPAALPGKAGSVGVAIPGGRLSIDADGRETADAGVVGEIVYSGPNVMLGYAEGPADLAEGDVLGGVLRTGDLGRFDADGHLFVVGRTKRFAKLFGLRVNLEDVETRVRARAPAAVVGAQDRILVYCEALDAAACAAVRTDLSQAYGLAPSSIVLRSVPALPRTSAGKIDYPRLEAESHGP